MQIHSPSITVKPAVHNLVLIISPNNCGADVKKTSTLAALALVPALSLVPSVGSAGQYLNFPVGISQVSRYAQGSLSSTRMSLNSTEYIYCFVTINRASSGVANTGQCHARNATGATAFCTTTDAALIDAMKSLTPASYMRFSWEGVGTCTQIFVNTGSWNLE